MSSSTSPRMRSDVRGMIEPGRSESRPLQNRLKVAFALEGKACRIELLKIARGQLYIERADIFLDTLELSSAEQWHGPRSTAQRAIGHETDAQFLDGRYDRLAVK